MPNIQPRVGHLTTSELAEARAAVEALLTEPVRATLDTVLATKLDTYRSDLIVEVEDRQAIAQQ